MKLQKKKGPGLKLARPHFEKSALRTQAMAKGIGAAVKEAAPEEGEEEEVKGQMDFLERRAWDKLSTRKKRRFLRCRGEWIGTPPVLPGRGDGGRRAERGTGTPVREAGKRVPHGWSRTGTTEAPTPFQEGRPGNEGRPAGKGRKGAAPAGKAAGHAVSCGAAAAGPAGIGAATAKKAVGRFRRAFAPMMEAKAKAETEWMEEASRRMEEAKKAETFGGMAAGMAASFAVYLSVKFMSAVVSVVITLLSTLATVFPPVLLVTLVATLLVALVPLFSDSVQVGNNAIVEVARQELKKAEENIGGKKYKEWYGLDDEWCAMFVTWCADQCGYIESGVVPKTASVAELHTWYDVKGQYHGKAGYIPKAGDLVLFEGAGRSHVGIVEAWDAASSTVTTIEGNVEGNHDHRRSRVARYYWSIAAPDITAFCTPDYPASVGALSGDSNAEMVYRAFVDAGYTSEAAAAVCGNLAGEGGTDASGDLVIDSTENGGQGPGIGICQWTSPGRKNGFLAYAESKGEPWPETSLAVQLEYMMKELSGNIWLWTAIGAEYGEEYHIPHAQFKACRDVAFATTAFCANFEICHKADAHLENRIAYAQKVLDSFGAYTGQAASAESESGAGEGE